MMIRTYYNLLRDSLLVFVGFFVIFFTTVSLADEPATASDVLEKDNLETITQLIVMINCVFSNDMTFGSGIIFGKENDKLYIATANHVVRKAGETAAKVNVYLKQKPNKSIIAEVLGPFNSNLDLAVLQIENIYELGIETSNLNFNVLSHPDSFKRGDAVFPIGYPNGVPWGIPVMPDRIAQLVGYGITFQSAFISIGHSGGGLVDEGGVIAGMIVKDSPPFGQAINIDAISKQIKEWKFPLTLSLADGYYVDGKWINNNHKLFYLLDLKVKGNEVIGSGDLIGSENNLFMYKDGAATISVNINSLSNISGKIRGNKLILNVKGAWTQIERRTRGLVFGFNDEANYSITLNGNVSEDTIYFKYKFDFPVDGNDSIGNFVAKRVVSKK